MANQSIAERVDSMEVRVNRLEEIPGRMDRLEGQLLELRSEMREQFSATRGEMHTLHAEAMAQTRTLFEEALDRIARTKEGQPARTDSPQRRGKKR